MPLPRSAHRSGKAAELSTCFLRALVRPPGETYAAGLTSATAGAPNLAKALDQHRRYVAALSSCGLEVTALPADPRFPDSTFIEDTAVLTPAVAIVTRPGALSRRGETESIAAELGQRFGSVRSIESPGTLDGGDVCETDGRFYIGLSSRTNADGARQLAAILAEHGYAATVVDIRSSPVLLHLKTGIAYLGDGRLALLSGLAELADFSGFECLEVGIAEGYAANCVRINDRVLVAAGNPRFTERLAALGLKPLSLEMSEFRKMDGGLSCLSLRF